MRGVASISARSRSVSARSAAAALSRTCAGSDAFGMEITCGCRSPQASATRAGVTPWRAATAIKAGERSRRLVVWDSGEYAMIASLRAAHQGSRSYSMPRLPGW